MNTNLMPYTGGALDRRTGRTLAELESKTAVEVAQLRQREDVSRATVEAMVGVTQYSLQGVAVISQVEQQLAQAVPLAGSRLQGIADLGALGVGQILMDAACQLRRR